MDLLKIKIDKVHPNAYYHHLLLNLPKLLKREKQVDNVYLKRLRPLMEYDLTHWEDYQGVFLPGDMKDFYLAHNGFLLTWNYTTEPEKKVIANAIIINQLQDVQPLCGYYILTKPCITMENGMQTLNLDSKSKVFRLAPIDYNHTVCLVYLNIWLQPTIWLHVKPDQNVNRIRPVEFYYLARDFTTYMRMCTVHLGISHWQLLYMKEPTQNYYSMCSGLPRLSYRLLNKLVPHLLRDNCKEDKQLAIGSTSSECENDDEEVVVNVLDSSVFLYSYLKYDDGKMPYSCNSNSRLATGCTPMMNVTRKPSTAPGKSATKTRSILLKMPAKKEFTKRRSATASQKSLNKRK